MDIGLLFWVLILFAIIVYFLGWWGPAPYRDHLLTGNGLFTLVLIIILGWAVFGPMLKSGGHG